MTERVESISSDGPKRLRLLVFQVAHSVSVPPTLGDRVADEPVETDRRQVQSAFHLEAGVGLVSSAGPLSAERRAHRSRRHWPGLKPTSRLNTRVK